MGAAPSPPPPATDEEQSLHTLRAWVAQRLGLHFERQIDTFEQRILAYCRSRAMTPAEVVAELERETPAVVIGVAEAVSTNHTAFFREPEAFQLLRETIVPTLPKRDPLRLWSAAASSGEEAYSIAFTLRERLAPFDLARVRILGTDLSPRQLLRAELGRYPRFMHPSDEPFTALFELEGEDLVVPRDVRAMCVFRTLNLTRQPWPFTQQFNVVFLRNVLYYFDVDMQRRVVEACYDVTAPGGWLVTSLTEPLLDLKTRWERVGPGVHRRGAR